MSLQPTNRSIDRTTTAPFLLRLFYRAHTPLTPQDFCLAPPADTTEIPDYASILPAEIRQDSLQIYTWPNCTLSELTALMTSAVPEGVLEDRKAGTRLVYKLIFPDTRGAIDERGRGKWVERMLGSVVIGEEYGHQNANGDVEMNGDASKPPFEVTGEATKTLADARFVIGDYVACTIYPPSEGRVAPLPPPSRDPYSGPRGPPQMNGYGGPRGGGYRGGYGGRGGAPPMSDWRRGERPPGYGDGARYGGGGYGGRGRGPY